MCREIDLLGGNWILSNSDVKANNNNFFDELYSDFKIMRVQARRNINSNPNKRGVLNELLITNEQTVIPRKDLHDGAKTGSSVIATA